MTATNLWVYKCNRHSDQEGDWDEFFDRSGRGGLAWGGTWSTGSGAARQAIADVQKGDLVLCYQVDERAILGLAKVRRLDEDKYDITLVLSPVERFAQPFITRGNERIKAIKAFQRG